jgi:LysR family glycine cleavage system transcriptional activator
VRAFEAASRHRSFKQAADELHVTQSAISHQVKRLEAWLGVALFRRHAHGVELTQTGVEYFRDLGAVLDELDASTGRAMVADADDELRVRATPAFLSRWLLPRLDRFTRAYPGIHLDLSLTDQPMRFPKEGVDILIQYGEEPAPGLRVDPFLASTRFPVCSPTWLARGAIIRRPEDLFRTVLLRDRVGDGWADWFECAGKSLPPTIKGPCFAHCELSLQAAERGQGVALAYGELVADEIAAGKLVKLFDLETPPKVIYSLTCPERWTNRPPVAAFRNWVLQEAGRQAGPH